MQLQKLLDSCIDGVKKISTECGVLLLFDTVELFIYPTGTNFVPAWDWLQSWISDLPRGTVIFAGHSKVSPLFKILSIPEIPLDTFTLEECRDYILKAVEKLTDLENREAFKITDNEISTLHELSEGSPILLAIFLELRMRDDPQEFRNLSEIKQGRFKEKIINYLISEPDLGEVLKAAGRARKGINAELLARIRDNDNPQVQTAEELIKKIQERIFVKIGDDNNRVFLHDEIYGLLQKHVYAVETSGPASDQQDAAHAIYNYYDNAIKQKNEELQSVFYKLTQPSFEHPTASTEEDVARIRNIETSRHSLKIEFVYYRLRNKVKKEGKRKWADDDPILAGLKMFYRYGHEAATSNNDEILMPLQIVLTEFLGDLKNANPWKPFIEGMLLINNIWLMNATGQIYKDHIPNLEQKLKSIANLTDNQKDVLHALLKTWLSTGLVFSKDPEYDRAEAIFTNVINHLENLPIDQTLKWFIDTAISLAYRQRAYLRRVRGLFPRAIEDYRSGLRFSRATHFLHEEATLQNDLGVSQLHMGEFKLALESLKDGLQLRYRTAIGPRIALSHSSLAQFYIADGAYEDARKHADNTIKISKLSEKVGYWRGQVFGNLALAEAARRFAFTFSDVTIQAEYLRQAQEAIETSVQRAEKINEKSRIIDSKLEEACLYRDYSRIEKEPTKKREWFDKSAALLWEVAEKAKEAGINYRLVDAMCNRVWLGYFSSNIDFAIRSANEFEELDILAAYWFESGSYKNKDIAMVNPILWSHIGKYCMARGVISLDDWRGKHDDDALVKTAHYSMLSLMYSEQFAKDHRGLRDGRYRIRQEIVKLDSDELQKFNHFVLIAEKNEGIPERTSALYRLLQDHALWVIK